MKIEIEKLRPHPLNHKIYGFEENGELMEKIKASNWLQPILISPNCTIISGHRRVECCRKLGIAEIECQIIEGDPIRLLEIMLSCNAYRVKSNLQLLREAEWYRDIEQKRAYQRMVHAKDHDQLACDFKNTGSGLSDEEFSMSLIEKGKTRDFVAEKIGMAGSSYDKGRKVLEKIDSTYDEEIREFFGDTLNLNIDAASKLASKSDEEIKSIIERTEGDPQKVSTVIRELEKEKIECTTPLPPGRYQIITMDMTRFMTADLQSIAISNISEPCSLVFLWVLPHQVQDGIILIKSWDFRYASCLLWQLDKKNEISTKGELCLIGIKGSPNIVFKNFPGSIEKPTIFKDIIERGYTGWSRVELKVGEGWEIW